MQNLKFIDIVYNLKVAIHKNNPAAQAAGADPSQCNQTNRQNPPIQQNFCNFWTSNAILMSFKI